MDNIIKQPAIKKALRLMKHRPSHLYRMGRCYALFRWSRCLRQLMPFDGVTLEENVRLQSNLSVMAESPHASITIGSNSIIYEDTRIESYCNAHVSIGASSIIGGAHIVSRYRIKIGERFLCSWNVFIQDYDAHPTTRFERRKQVEYMVANFRPSFKALKSNDCMYSLWNFPGEEIHIGDDVWVGAGATILKGAKIGSGSIVATGAIVLRGEYAERSLIAGNPARVVRELKDYPSSSPSSPYYYPEKEGQKT